MLSEPIKPEDYFEPVCPFCFDAFEMEKPIKSVPISRIILKLDEYTSKNDYVSAEKHLNYWLCEAEIGNDLKGMLTVYNELMGVYRKTNQKEKALGVISPALDLIEKLGFEETVTGGTTFVNAATVYKAFGLADKAIPIFKKAKINYEKLLNKHDARLGGLYNNMALAYVDTNDFSTAIDFYNKAIEIMGHNKKGELEQAITYLNIANAYENELGLEDAQDKISECIEKAAALLNTDEIPRNGYYAFVCEKCAPSFGYYGYFAFENELKSRAREIYERT